MHKVDGGWDVSPVCSRPDLGYSVSIDARSHQAYVCMDGGIRDDELTI